MANNIHDVDEFGDLPQNLLNRLSQILSRRRVITSRTLDLFLRPDLNTIDLYDCGSKFLFSSQFEALHLTLYRTGGRRLHENILSSTQRTKCQSPQCRPIQRRSYRLYNRAQSPHQDPPARSRQLSVQREMDPVLHELRPATRIPQIDMA